MRATRWFSWHGDRGRAGQLLAVHGDVPPAVLRFACVALLAPGCAAEDPGSDYIGELQQAKVMFKDLPSTTDLPMLSLPDPCLELPLFDADPEAPGTQYDCSMTEWSEADGERVVPACDAGGTGAFACFRLVTDTDNCFYADRVKISVVRTEPADAEHHLLLQCASR